MSLFQSLRGLFRSSQQQCIRSISTTPVPLKGAGGGGPKKPSSGNKPGGGFGASGKSVRRSQRGNDQPRDPKMINLMRHLAVLNPKRIPAPLRMARNRYLRHWTIHRAWLLFRRKQREERERVWMKQYQSMNRACEELRLTSGPDTRPEGYLFRVAMEKWGVYGLKGVPIEYARPQVETPPRVAWSHDWKP
ncbi:hypothetical protein QBC38DRAFT_478458 [Podospora fimiseda]|uniref:Large ribosomal subunit protein mL40 n=1 Tax=Podospora fimiseda TaxID=252190 RepID=A0AAN7BPK8_9PEZI|nr:hypothetical protein QBC38DRAFT_478458 [Podospora fimiseda]